MLRRPLGKEVEKTVIFRPPWTVKMRLTLKRELNFHFSEGFPKYSQNGATMEPKWLPNPPEDAPRALRSAPEKESKNDTEIGAKREPKWRPKGVQNRSKKVSKNEVDRRRAPGAPQGRFV